MFAHNVTRPKSEGMEIQVWKRNWEKTLSVYLIYYLYINIYNTDAFIFTDISTLLRGVSPSLIVKSGDRAESHIHRGVVVHIFLGVF